MMGDHIGPKGTSVSHGLCYGSGIFFPIVMIRCGGGGVKGLLQRTHNTSIDALDEEPKFFPET